MSIAKFRDSIAGPTVILLAICLLITLALAVVNQVTAPIIAESQIKAANAARAKVLPTGDSFSLMENIILPTGVSEAYRADNGAGYVFRSSAKGFDGSVVFIVGIDIEGNITGIQMFEHNETPGLGTRIGELEFLEGFYGNRNPNEVAGVTGATLTSNALKNALTQAKEAYQAVKEAA